MPRKTNNDEVSSPGTTRLSIPLSPEGGIDWAGMRGSTREKLTALVEADVKANPDQWGINDDSSATDALPALTEANVAEALDIVAKANALVFRVGAARFIKHPLKRTPDGKQVPFVLDMDVLLQAFTLTKEQHAELDPRATRLAQKYTPAFLTKNLDMYMLVAMYLKYTADNAQLAMKMQLQRDVAQAMKAQANAAATTRPVDSDVRRPVPEPATASGPVNGHAQPGASFQPEPESFEPGSDSAIAP